MTRKRAADLQPGDVVDLEEGLDENDAGDIVTIEEVTTWAIKDGRLIAWVKGDKFPVYLSPDDEFTVL